MKIDIESINEEWSKDAIIDTNNLSTESLKTPMLHAKWLRIYSQILDTRRKTREKINRLKYYKRKWYRGQCTKEDLERLGWEQYQHNKVLESKLETVLDEDEDVAKVNKQVVHIDNLEIIVKQILDELKRRDWQIKNSISYRMLVNNI